MFEPSDIRPGKTISKKKRNYLIIKSTFHQIFDKLDYLGISQENFLVFDINLFSFK
jgi:hypothetical protein